MKPAQTTLNSGQLVRIKVIGADDANIVAGLSPYNWIIKGPIVSSSVGGASVRVRFDGTRHVALQADARGLGSAPASRFPILAWTVNDGPVRTHQIKPDGAPFTLAEGVADPVIDLYIKGMSPFEDRWPGDVPQNAVNISGFVVDENGKTAAAKQPEKVWLNIGDSIMAGDGAAYATDQGRPKNDLWAESDDGRASYGYLLARHFGYRESRIATGGYNWKGGLAKMPALATLIDQQSAGVSRLKDEKLSPAPSVVLINLGTNGRPADEDVTSALKKIRLRSGKDAKIIVMVPVSGAARAEVTRAFTSYKSEAHDERAYLIDLGTVKFATTDKVHPTAEGHQQIFKAALPVLEAIVTPKEPAR